MSRGRTETFWNQCRATQIRRTSGTIHEDSEPSTSSKLSYFQRTSNQKSSDIMNRIRLGFQKKKEEEKSGMTTPSSCLSIASGQTKVSDLFSSVLKKIKSSLNEKYQQKQDKTVNQEAECLKNIQIHSTQSEESDQSSIKANSHQKLKKSDQSYQQKSMKKKEQINKTEPKDIAKPKTPSKKKIKSAKIKNIQKKKTKAANKKYKNKLNSSLETSEIRSEEQDPEVSRLQRAKFRYQNEQIIQKISNLRVAVRQKKFYQIDTNVELSMISKESQNQIRRTLKKDISKRLLIEVQ